MIWAPHFDSNSSQNPHTLHCIPCTVYYLPSDMVRINWFVLWPKRCGSKLRLEPSTMNLLVLPYTGVRYFYIRFFWVVLPVVITGILRVLCSHYRNTVPGTPGPRPQVLVAGSIYRRYVQISLALSSDWDFPFSFLYYAVALHGEQTSRWKKQKHPLSSLVVNHDTYSGKNTIIRTTSTHSWCLPISGNSQFFCTQESGE